MKIGDSTSRQSQLECSRAAPRRFSVRSRLASPVGGLTHAAKGLRARGVASSFNYGADFSGCCISELLDALDLE